MPSKLSQFLAIVLFVLVTASVIFAATPAVEWQVDYQEALRQSQLTGKPIFLKSNMPDCEFCRMFEEVLKEEKVASRLADFVLYRLDLDIDPEQARKMSINAAPVLRLIAPTGGAVAEHIGAMEADEFLKWLTDSEEKGRLMTPSKVAANPKSVLVIFDGADPVMREIATQALIAPISAPGNTELRKEVVDKFVNGNLSVRLGLLELLRQSGAPVSDMDPWKPDTIAAAQATLLTWAESGPAVPEQAFTHEEIERDLQVWMTAEEGPETRACYERLSRAGEKLLPRLKELMPETWNRARERLTTLQYRLLMSRQFAAEFPNTPFFMSSRDPDVRMRAVNEIAKAVRIKGKATGMEQFFLNVFYDPDARVREASLRGLRETGQGLARQQVLKFLQDPSPNVRAGILNDLAVSPLPDMDTDLKEYALKEEDDDLVVHAARALRRIRGRPEAFNALLALASHKSWRVRSEAVEAFGETSTWKETPDEFSESQSREVAGMMKKVLADEDAFVVAKALDITEDLGDVDLSNCLDEFVAIVDKHPNIAEKAIKAIASHSYLRKKASDQVKVLCQHQLPEVRAAAISALLLCTKAPMKDEVLAAMADEDTRVRAAAASSICQYLYRVKHEIPYEKSEQLGPVKTHEMILSAIPEPARNEFISALRKNMSSEDKDERFASLLALAILNDTEIALPGLINVIVEFPELAEDFDQFSYFLYEDRKRLFAAVKDLPITDEAWALAFSCVFHSVGPEANDYFWEIFNNDPHIPLVPDTALVLASSVAASKPDLWYTSDASVPEIDKERLSIHANEQMASADPRRKAIGLLLLLRVDKERGMATVNDILQKHESGEQVDSVLYVACMEVRLAMAGEEVASYAIKALSDDNELVRKSSFESLLQAFSLTENSSVRIHVGEETVYPRFLKQTTSSSMYNVKPTQWNPPALPEELPTALIRKFLDADDPEERNGAAMLLALKGDDSGFPVLLESSRDAGGASFEGILLARAIRVLDRDEDIHYLVAQFENAEGYMKETFGANLYWSIRAMKGPNATEFRARLRKELGQALMQER